MGVRIFNREDRMVNNPHIIATYGFCGFVLFSEKPQGIFLLTREQIREKINFFVKICQNDLFYLHVEQKKDGKAFVYVYII